MTPFDVELSKFVTKARRKLALRPKSEIIKNLKTRIEKINDESATDHDKFLAALAVKLVGQLERAKTIEDLAHSTLKWAKLPTDGLSKEQQDAVVEAETLLLSAKLD